MVRWVRYVCNAKSHGDRSSGQAAGGCKKICLLLRRSYAVPLHGPFPGIRCNYKHMMVLVRVRRRLSGLHKVGHYHRPGYCTVPYEQPSPAPETARTSKRDTELLGTHTLGRLMPHPSFAGRMLVAVLLGHACRTWPVGLEKRLAATFAHPAGSSHPAQAVCPETIQSTRNRLLVICYLWDRCCCPSTCIKIELGTNGWYHLPSGSS